MISLYGFIISFSIFVAVLLAEKLAKDARKDPDVGWGAAFWVILGGLVGARLYHVVDFLPYYLQNPVKIVHFWEGGLGILGGVAGGILGLSLFLKSKKEPLLEWLDIAGVVTPLAQSIGRWGNFANQEVYGLPSKLPWAIYIKPNNRLNAFKSYERFHPLFLYESVLNLILFLALFFLFKKKGLKSGVVFYLYLFGYSIIRFFLEFLRADSWRVYGFNVAQVITLLIIISVGSFLIRSGRLKPR